MLTLRTDEGSFLWAAGVRSLVWAGVSAKRRRICDTCREVLRMGDPKESEGWEEVVCFLDMTLMISSAALRR